MLGRIKSKNLLKLIDEIFNEIQSRDDAYIARNGNVYLTKCPDCGRKITVDAIQINMPQYMIDIVLESKSFGERVSERWKNFLVREQNAGHIKLPYVSGCDWQIPPQAPGNWHLCSCACRLGNWAASYDAAIASYMTMPVYKLTVAEAACK